MSCMPFFHSVDFSFFSVDSCVSVRFSSHLISIAIFPVIDRQTTTLHGCVSIVVCQPLPAVVGKLSSRSLLNIFVVNFPPKQSEETMFYRFACVAFVVCLLFDAFKLNVACRLLVPPEMLNGCIFDPMIVERNSEFDGLPGYSVSRQNCNTVVKKDLFGAQPVLYYGRARSVCRYLIRVCVVCVFERKQQSGIPNKSVVNSCAHSEWPWNIDTNRRFSREYRAHRAVLTNICIVFCRIERTPFWWLIPIIRITPPVNSICIGWSPTYQLSIHYSVHRTISQFLFEISFILGWMVASRSQLQCWRIHRR